MRRTALVAALFAAFLLIPSTASAQSAQLWSLQFSGLGSSPFGGELDNISLGVGWEAQLRVNPSVWSFGFGVEQTFHDVNQRDDRSVTLLGGFFEPRLVILVGSESAAPYLSARFAVSQFSATEGELETSATGFTVNGGGGVLIRMSDRVNLDLGATVGFKQLGEGPDLFNQNVILDWGSGANAIGRVGLAIGLGG